MYVCLITSRGNSCSEYGPMCMCVCAHPAKGSLFGCVCARETHNSCYRVSSSSFCSDHSLPDLPLVTNHVILTQNFVFPFSFVLFFKGDSAQERGCGSSHKTFLLRTRLFRHSKAFYLPFFVSFLLLCAFIAITIILQAEVVWLKGGAIVVLFFCYSGHLDLVQREGRCYFMLLFSVILGSSEPHQ